MTFLNINGTCVKLLALLMLPICIWTKLTNMTFIYKKLKIKILYIETKRKYIISSSKHLILLVLETFAFFLLTSSYAAIYTHSANDFNMIITNDDSFTTNNALPFAIDIFQNDSICVAAVYNSCEPVMLTNNIDWAVHVLTPPTHGNIVLNVVDNQLIGFDYHSLDYTYTGQDLFQYVLCFSDNEICDTATVLLNYAIPQDNAPPIAINDSFTTLNSNDITINLLANDIDSDGDLLDFEGVIVPPQHGLLSYLVNGILNYMPNTGYVGTDSLVYVVSDNIVPDTATAYFELMAPVNANDDFTNTILNTPVTVNVLVNDLVGQVEEVAINISVPPSNGTTFIDDGFNIISTPNTDFLGNDTIIYVLDDQLSTDEGTIIITVSEDAIEELTAVNDTFNVVAYNDSIFLSVLLNDITTNENNIFIAGIITNPDDTSFVQLNDSMLVHLPNTNSGNYVATVSYIIIDEDGNIGNIAEVTVNVIVPPVANTDIVNTLNNSSINIAVLDNDFTNNDTPLSIATVFGAEIGAFTILNDNDSITYIPNSFFTGVDTIFYTLSDGFAIDTGLLIINVLPINSLPTAVADTIYFYAATASGVLAVLNNDLDPDGDDLQLVSANSLGIEGLGVSVGIIEPVLSISIENFSNGTYSFTYTISDGAGGNVTGMVVIIVDIITLLANEDSYEIFTNEQAISFDILLNDTIATNGNDFIVNIDVIDAPEGSSIALNESNQLQILSLPLNYTGTILVNYTLQNTNASVSSSTQVSIVVQAIPLIAQDDFELTEQGVALLINPLENDSTFAAYQETLIVLELITASETGVAGLVNDTAIQYMPDGDFFGIDTLTYIVSNGSSTDTASIYINVLEGNNNNFQAINDTFTLATNEISILYVLANDIFGSDSNISISIVEEPLQGMASVTTDTILSYLPNTNHIGSDFISYTISDGTTTDTASVYINVIEGDIPENCDIFVPTGFSPNGDGVHDQLIIENINACYAQNSLIIFNRSGAKVFSRQNYNNFEAWAGENTNGEPLSNGTYFYVLLNAQEQLIQQGAIELKR